MGGAGFAFPHMGDITQSSYNKICNEILVYHFLKNIFKHREHKHIFLKSAQNGGYIMH